MIFPFVIFDENENSVSPVSYSLQVYTGLQPLTTISFIIWTKNGCREPWETLGGTLLLSLILLLSNLNYLRWVSVRNNFFFESFRWARISGSDHLKCNRLKKRQVSLPYLKIDDCGDIPTTPRTVPRRSRPRYPNNTDRSGLIFWGKQNRSPEGLYLDPEIKTETRRYDEGQYNGLSMHSIPSGSPYKGREIRIRNHVKT